MQKYKIRSKKDFRINVLGNPLLSKEDSIIVTDVGSNEIKNLKKQDYISVELVKEEKENEV